MILVTDTRYNVTVTVEYETIDEMVEDYVTNEIVEEWLNKVYGYKEIGALKFGAGAILHKCLDETEWSEYVDNFIGGEIKFIEDQLASNGECNWYDLYITDPSYAEEEEEE